MLTLLSQNKTAPKQKSANIQGPVKPRYQELKQFICFQPLPTRSAAQLGCCHLGVKALKPPLLPPSTFLNLPHKTHAKKIYYNLLHN